MSYLTNDDFIEPENIKKCLIRYKNVYFYFFFTYDPASFIQANLDFAALSMNSQILIPLMKP